MRCQPLLLTIISLLTACSPSLNWRDVSPAGDDLMAMLPCKPDRGSRRQTLAGQEVEIRMLGCEAGGGLYAIAAADLGKEASPTVMQAQWQASLLGNMQASSSTTTAWRIQGASALTEPVLLSATGRRGDGRPVAVQAVWFSRGERLYHAAIYGERISSEMSDPFFSALRLL